MTKLVPLFDFGIAYVWRRGSRASSPYYVRFRDGRERRVSVVGEVTSGYARKH